MERITLKRIYDPQEAGDGARVLVDRIWPRGVRKQEAGVDRWLPEVAPSSELRRWFGHRPERWAEFRTCYLRELAQCPGALRDLLGYVRRGRLTLLYAARDRERNQAVVLREVLLGELAEEEHVEPSSPTCLLGQFPDNH